MSEQTNDIHLVQISGEPGQEGEFRVVRPPRPEIDWFELHELVGTFQAWKASRDSEHRQDLWLRFIGKLVKHTEALVYAVQEYDKLREKLARVIAKSNARRGQLRQMNIHYQYLHQQAQSWQANWSAERTRREQVERILAQRTQTATEQAAQINEQRLELERLSGELQRLRGTVSKQARQFQV